MSQDKVEIIPPQTLLSAKVGGRVIDQAAIAKAEAALKGLAANFAQWLQDEIEKLEAARRRLTEEGVNNATLDGLYLRAHDLKGLGSTYEYPLVTRMAASLCKLLDDPDKREKTPLPLIDAHIQAIKASVRDGVKSEDHPVGQAVVVELETRVREALG